MAAVHDILVARGKQETVEAGFDRSVVEVASAYLSLAVMCPASCAVGKDRRPRWVPRIGTSTDPRA